MAEDISSRHRNRQSLLLAAILIVAGVVVSALAGVLHPEGPDPNDHPAVFAQYAQSGSWTAVHLGQFVGMAMIVAGLVAFYFAIDTGGRVALWLGRMALTGAVAALAVYAVLQAVDGVGLKQAVDAWAAADDAEKEVRFAAAETVRWLEWAVRSYHSFVFGVTLVLFGAAIAIGARIPRLLGYVMALSGVTYLIQGWIVGASGFSAANSIPTLVGIVLVVIWSIWLLVFAIRDTARSTTREARVP